MCEACDTKIHNKAKRLKHERNPLDFISTYVIKSLIFVDLEKHENYL